MLHWPAPLADRGGVGNGACDVLLRARGGVRQRASNRQARGDRGRERASRAMRPPRFDAAGSDLVELFVVIEQKIDDFVSGRRRVAAGNDDSLFFFKQKPAYEIFT